MNLKNAHTINTEDLLNKLRSSKQGLTSSEAKKRFDEYGANVFPTKKAQRWYHIFFHQFLNPLTYILLAASLISIFVQHYTDAFFIGVVLLLNAIIGTIQEFQAERSAAALLNLSSSKSSVLRDNNVIEIDAEEVVPGDIVLLESGKKVPADLRLISTKGLEVDESLLTGESLAVQKDHSLKFDEETPPADRLNMAFMGSLIKKGRATGVVIATALHTELGKIADSLEVGVSAKAPLLIRMENFTRKIAIFLLFVTIIMSVVLLLEGHTWFDVMMFTVALAVSAIPEGLPVALTVALAVASRRMAKKNVIVRKLPAVESLGSCTYIATDKTGTLTVNQLTITRIGVPETPVFEVSGSGLVPDGEVLLKDEIDSNKQTESIGPLALCGVLCNEGNHIHHEGTWKGHGDAVDIAFLVLAKKIKLSPESIRKQYQLIEEVPFEADNQYAATLHEGPNGKLISVKGALEKILPMCKDMMTMEGTRPIDAASITEEADKFAESGFRVLALAGGQGDDLDLNESKLTFFGIVGMIDPLRPEALEAIASCHGAGIEVAMVTGDHPKTSLAIARELGLAHKMSEVVSGPQLKSASSEKEKSKLIEDARVFARVEPQQKLEIVQYLINQGQFVAVTGDGANDAPALKAANVGVAMGKTGTDVAKETADLIITDDRFASIVAGIEEGRIAYSNIRKVVYLLISTGAAEIFLFMLTLIFDTPMPLTAVQLLWLNLVTNGIQHVGLAFEPAEGDELTLSPRKPKESIFDRLMLERVIISAITMGTIAYFQFNAYINQGIDVDTARNLTLLLMVLFENIMILNCRSETKSAFIISPLSNKILLFGTLGAQFIHILALYTPGLNTVLVVAPIAFSEWVKLLFEALSVLVVIEIYKFIKGRNRGQVTKAFHPIESR